MRVNGGEGWGREEGAHSATPFTSPPFVFVVKVCANNKGDDEMKQWLKGKRREDRTRGIPLMKGRIHSSTNDIIQ